MNPLDEKTARQILEWAKWYADRINIKSHAFDRDDLIGVGVLAAVEAIPRWNPQRSKLITFLGHRIKGALRDYIRRYVNGRRKTEGYCDHTVERFGDIQGSWEDKVSSGAFDDRKSLDDAMEGPNLDGTSAFEAMEFLEHWRHCMSERDYRILFLRYGEGMTQKETGRILGVHECSISLIEKRLRKRFDLPMLEKQTVDGVGRQRAAKVMRAPRR